MANQENFRLVRIKPSLEKDEIRSYTTVVRVFEKQTTLSSSVIFAAVRVKYGRGKSIGQKGDNGSGVMPV